MTAFTNVYNLYNETSVWPAYMGFGPIPDSSFTLHITATDPSIASGTSYFYGPSGGLTWKVMAYDPTDFTRYAEYNTVGGTIYPIRETQYIVNYSESGIPTTQSTDVLYEADHWTFHGGMSVYDLPGSALCIWSPETTSYLEGYAPNGHDAAGLLKQGSGSQIGLLSYDLIPRYVYKLDKVKVYAERAEQDKDGNRIDQTYAKIADMAAVSFSGSYTDLSDLPTIPSKTSELQNDSGFVTASQVPTKTSDLQNDSGFVTASQVPTATSDLTNDSGFITISDVPNADWTSNSGLSQILNKPTMKPLLAGTGLTITENTNDVTMDCTVPTVTIGTVTV